MNQKDPQPASSLAATVILPEENERTRTASLAHLDDSLGRTATVDSQKSAVAPARTGAPAEQSVRVQPGSPLSTQLGRRATVLPRVTAKDSGLALAPTNQDRYQTVRPLGAGAMGEVSLEHDNDIGRTVAVKRLSSDSDRTNDLLRFVSEVRTIGQLEHPNIVPIHDVGLDENGRYYFVMKYVDGETLQAIIAKLVAGDPEYHARYPNEVRLEIILGLLHALQYAHSRGVIHRDVKPANIMVGRYGEVVLMDWGIAKQLRGGWPLPGGPARIREEPTSESERLLATRSDQLIGTPAYMSPEQALGRNDKIDERSDVYSALVVLHELLALRHYFIEHQSLNSMILAIGTEPMTLNRLRISHHPRHPPIPAEFVHLLGRGLAKDPAQRFQSASSLIEAIQQILEGRMRIDCPVTFLKRLVRAAGRFIDRFPAITPWVFYPVVVMLFFSVVYTTYSLLR